MITNIKYELCHGRNDSNFDKVSYNTKHKLCYGRNHDKYHKR